MADPDKWMSISKDPLKETKSYRAQPTRKPTQNRSSSVSSWNHLKIIRLPCNLSRLVSVKMHFPFHPAFQTHASLYLPACKSTWSEKRPNVRRLKSKSARWEPATVTDGCTRVGWCMGLASWTFQRFTQRALMILVTCQRAQLTASPVAYPPPF